MPRRFGGSESGSLRKMELNGGRRGDSSGRGRFNMANVFGDPFSLATIGIAFSGWLISFVSSIVANLGSTFPNFAWWTLAYMFCCIVGIFAAVATDTTYQYHVAIVGFMAAGLVFTTSSVNSLIYFPEASKEAAAAGFILLSMVAIVWIFYYGSEPQAPHRQTIDSFALHKDHAPSRRGSRHMTQSYGQETRQSGGPQQVVNSANLVGFETTSPVTQYPGTRPGDAPPQHQTGNAFANAQTNGQPPSQSFLGSGAAQELSSTTNQPAEYPYRAKAIYSYEANPDDANEISFSKHEILEVSDVSGRWWQARKDGGETGIAPSNYLILL